MRCQSLAGAACLCCSGAMVGMRYCRQAVFTAADAYPRTCCHYHDSGKPPKGEVGQPRVCVCSRVLSVDEEAGCSSDYSRRQAAA